MNKINARDATREMVSEADFISDCRGQHNITFTMRSKFNHPPVLYIPRWDLNACFLYKGVFLWNLCELYFIHILILVELYDEP